MIKKYLLALSNIQLKIVLRIEKEALDSTGTKSDRSKLIEKC